jgi:hypothetical protein
MPRDAVLCVQCGYNTQTGRRVETIIESDAEEQVVDEFAGQYESHGVELLDKAERDMLYQKKQDRMLTKGAPWWSVLLAFLATTSFVGAMMIWPPDKALHVAGIVLMIIAAGIAACCAIVVIVIGFFEGVPFGLLNLFVPPYMLYYVFTRWKKCKSPFIYIVASGAVCFVGFLFLKLAPMLGGGEDNGGPSGDEPVAMAPADWTSPLEGRSAVLHGKGGSAAAGHPVCRGPNAYGDEASDLSPASKAAMIRSTS